MNQTRRDFIRRTTALAVGAAVGALASVGIKEHGPVTIRAYFLNPEPIEIDGRLFSDEGRDVFGIWVFSDETGLAELPLSSVRGAVAKSGRLRTTFTMRGEKKTETGHVALSAEGGKLMLWADDPRGGDPAPVWLMIEDVRRVL